MKKRTSNEIKLLVVAIALIIIVAFIGMIIFVMNVDVKNNNVPNNQQQTAENTTTTEKSKVTNVVMNLYNITKSYENDDIQVSLIDGKVVLKIEDKENEVATHGNVIQDVCVGKIGKKQYLFVLTNNGAIGTMDIDEAIKNDVFRIKNKLVSFEASAVRITNATMKKENGGLDTVLVSTSDGKVYDLSDIVE